MDWIGRSCNDDDNRCCRRSGGGDGDGGGGGGGDGGGGDGGGDDDSIESHPKPLPLKPQTPHSEPSKPTAIPIPNAFSISYF